MNKKKAVFQFEENFETGEYIAANLGRLQLASGNIVRIIFTPKGMQFIIEESSKDNGDIRWSKGWDQVNFGSCSVKSKNK